jgi:hypothetical protein
MNFKKIIKRSIITLLLLIIIPGITALGLILAYKGELSNMLVEHVKTQYGVEANVGDVKFSLFESWPNATVKLTDVSVTSTVDNGERKPFLIAGALGISFDLKKLLSKEFVVHSVSIRDGVVNLIRDYGETGNFKFLKPKGMDANQKLVFDLKKINLRNVKFYFQNKPLRKRISIQFKNNTIRTMILDDGFKANITGEVFVGGLLFDQKKGAFLKNKSANVDVALTFLKKNKTILINEPSCVTIDDQKYNVNAYAEFEGNRLLNLHVSSQGVDFHKGMTILNAKIQQSMERFKITNTVDIDALLIVRIGEKQDPQMDIKFNTNKNNITIGESKIPYKNISLNGQILSLPDSTGTADLNRAQIFLRNIKGEVYDFPFNADVVITNLKNPSIDIKGDLFIESKNIKFKAGKDFIMDGACTAKVKYNGPMEHLNRHEFLNPPMVMHADLSFKNFSYKADPVANVFTINGNAKVSNKDLKFDDLKLGTVGGNFLLLGFASGFTDYALGYSDGFKATLNAFTNTFDLNPFLKKPTADTKKAKEEKKKKLSETNLSVFDFKISLSAKEFVVRQLEATNVGANLNYTKDILTINNLYMNTCEGNLSANGTMRNLSDINAHVNLNGMNIRTLFAQCENFGQKAIDSKNLQGTLGAKVDMNITLNEDYEFMPQSMLGQVQLKLKDGHLLNFEPLQKISDYIFKNRNFEDVTFTAIDEVFKIKGYEMTIDNLEIASNVLNLYLNGVYNFKSESSLNMRIPWSNLRHRGKDYKPKNLGKEFEDAKGLKLNYSGLPKQMKLSLGNK